ncbi:hypothetical protein O181_123595 [Austropuccinia psidii MF-1]|uniref:Uncharacterized protein n=1 Tax=Austropuccinia psidii MF-1 TaxID=1389203 RepID=A0A9Q3Q4C9_9BASI|nr:hypothetical protein [Austropuccinia psidii MF-1]
MVCSLWAVGRGLQSVCRGLWSALCGRGGYWRPPGPKLIPEPKCAGPSGVPWDHKDSAPPKAPGEDLGSDFSTKETWTHHLNDFEGGPSLRYGPHFLEGIFFMLEVI